MATMPFNQDDERENAMVNALNLQRREGRARHEEDAHVDWEEGGRTDRLLFECKSAPAKKSFGTGRDTGLRKLEEWRSYHFVFGWFEARSAVPLRMWYGSPRLMREWIEGEIAYVQADLALAKLMPTKVDDDAAEILFGDKQEISYTEMRAVMKNYWNANAAQALPSRYDTYADLRRGRRSDDRLYSRDVGLKAAQDRVTYLLKRGVTVNNRKITSKYVIDHCIELNATAWAKGLETAMLMELELEPPSGSE